MILELDFLREAIPDAVILGTSPAGTSPVGPNPVGPNFVEYAVSIDTRTIRSGDIFLALRGDRTDGHDFLGQAVASGASALIIEKSEEFRLRSLKEFSGCVILVDDTMVALVNLARVWRRRFSYPVVGVTGSVGKTTTKEILRSILSASDIPACLSYKNQNTFVGLSLNILRMSHKHKVAVFEVGISQTGEMEQKADLLRPTIGVITTVAHAHMDGLGPLTGVAKEKKKLFSFFKPDNIGVIFGDNHLLDETSYSHPVIRFGSKIKNHVQARKVTGENFSLRLYKEQKNVSLKISHDGIIYNSLAATCVSHLLGISFSKIVEGIENFSGFEERFERRELKKDRGILISDCYNANPESMRAALLAIHKMSVKGKKIAILGDMLELGEKELFWHRQIGRVLGKALSIDHVILVGERAKSIGKTAPLTIKVDYTDNWQQAAEKLESELDCQNSLVLVKASHSMELDKLVERVAM